MSGHSKWATTKHKKAVIDARRGKMFAKLIKNIEVAARMGGGDLAGNPTLYDAIQKAKKSSVPNDNIDRAVKRGSGAEAGGADYSTIMYEGYGPNGVALLIECLTDNRNRAAMEVRTAMTRNGGSLADPGSVSYLFNRKGVVIVPTDQEGKQVTEDDVLEATLEAGAEEVNDLGESFEVVSRGHRPRRRPHRPAGRRHRLRLRRGLVRAEHAGRARPGRRRQGVPAGRGARGPRRRAERLRATSTSPTRSWRRSTPDRAAWRRRFPGAGDCCRTTDVSGDRLQDRHPVPSDRVSPDGLGYPTQAGAAASTPGAPAPGSGVRRLAWCEQVFGRPRGARHARARHRPRAHPVRRGRRRRLGGPAADAGRRRRRTHGRRPADRAAAVPDRGRARGVARRARSPTRSPSSGCSASTTCRP